MSAPLAYVGARSRRPPSSAHTDWPWALPLRSQHAMSMAESASVKIPPGPELPAARRSLAAIASTWVGSSPTVSRARPSTAALRAGVSVAPKKVRPRPINPWSVPSSSVTNSRVSLGAGRPTTSGLSAGVLSTRVVTWLIFIEVISFRLGGRLHYHRMRIGVLLPTRGVILKSARRPADDCWTMARLADEAGYDAVWVGDSIVAKPRLEPLTSLAYVAAMTSRVRLGTAVLLPALRHPVVLAHQIANLDQMSRGRSVLGLGVGWSLPSAEREWAACGADHKRRVRRLEEHVEIWRALWRGEPLSHVGDDFTLTEHTIGPLPWTETG